MYGAENVATPLPTQRMRGNAVRPKEARQSLGKELLPDGNSRQNLATFCQTWDDEQICKIMDLIANKEMIDHDEHPRCAEIEQRRVRMIAHRRNAPRGANLTACSSVGSSEAFMLGGLVVLRRRQKKRQEFTTDRASLSGQDMRRSMDFLVRHTSAHHLKESEALTFKHT